MKRILLVMTISLAVVLLSGCMTTVDSGNVAYEPTVYQQYSSSVGFYGLDSPGMRPASADIYQPTWSGSASATPVSSKDVDVQWVSNQNPQGYTIEIADGEKASAVARTLQSAPKSDRRAQIPYQHNGQSWFRGVYGSYPTAEAAQKALGNLPDTVKANATIRRWGEVQ